MKFILTLILSVFVTNCSIFQNKQEHLKGWSLFSQFEIDKDTEESVKRVLGNPSDIYNIKSKDKNKKIVQWTYFREEMSTIRIVFTNSLVQYISMDVWEDEDVQVLSYLLDKFPGKWKITQEEPISAHFMPTTCYLNDKALGKRIEIHGYKKVVESISKENPTLGKITDIKIEKQKIYPDVDPNRCAWLKDFLKTKGLLSDGETN